MKFYIFNFLILCSFAGFSQTPTVGLLQHDAGTLDDGYILFSPIANTTTYLIDKCGREIHSWQSAYKPGQSLYLDTSGQLIRTINLNNGFFNAGGQGGGIEKYDWNNNLLWHYTVSDSMQCQHHDIKPMKNGHILVIAWERKSVTEAIQAGRNPNLLGTSLWSEKVIELKPLGSDSAEIVWEWHVWDHLVQRYDSTKQNYGLIAQHPELINLNFNGSTNEDWLHFNAIDYNESLDQILLSNHNFSEIMVIDHSTTTAQAASHNGGNSGKGGDILWRWGNPMAYNQGTIANKQLFSQHSPHWIPNELPHSGDIMIFNNGNSRPSGDYSTIDIIHPPVDVNGNYASTLPYLPNTYLWRYQDSIPTDFYSKNISGAQQLSNGNVLICNGFYGEFFEIDSTMHQVWHYRNPVASTIYTQGSSTIVQNNVFRSTFYPADYAGFIGLTLQAGNPIELNPYPVNCMLTSLPTTQDGANLLVIYPNPCTDNLMIEVPNHLQQNKLTLFLHDLSGRCIKKYPVQGNKIHVEVSDINQGIYLLTLEENGVMFGRAKVQKIE